jgi:hypothetical protein
MLKRMAGSLTILLFLSAACYNTYYISREQLKELQTAEKGDREVVKSVDGEEVVVERDTGLAVRSEGGRKYPITPFNFSVTQTQLVASDRDTLLALSELRDEAEVQHLSTWKTVGLISLGVAAAAGLVVGLVLTGGEKSFSE